MFLILETVVLTEIANRIAVIMWPSVGVAALKSGLRTVASVYFTSVLLSGLHLVFNLNITIMSRRIWPFGRWARG